MWGKKWSMCSLLHFIYVILERRPGMKPTYRLFSCGQEHGPGVAHRSMCNILHRTIVVTFQTSFRGHSSVFLIVDIPTPTSVRNRACPLVRDKWLFTRTSKQSVSSYPLDKWKFTTIFYFSLSFYYNAVIERQNARDFTFENRQRSRCYIMSQKLHCFDLFGTSVICCIVIVRTLVHLLWL